MKSGMTPFLIIFLGIVAANCGARKVKKSQTSQPVFETAFDIDDRLMKTDSLVLVFYKHPYGDDSLRYTRYYTQISKVNVTDIRQLKEQLSLRPTREEKFRNCRGEGKIWCYSNGKVFQTLYFSARQTDCYHIYLIRDGFYYYTPLLQSFASWLASIKPFSKEPFE